MNASARRALAGRVAWRGAALGAATGTAVLLAAVPAAAHVTIEPTAAAQGSYATVDFKVPDEQDNADTVKVEIYFPTDHPLASVQTEPVPGWTATVTKTKLAKPVTTDDGQVTEGVSEITWTGGRIRPGEFEQFPVSMGPLPTDTGSLAFKALQTYDDNQVARWIEVPVSGRAEPEHPAPVLALTSAASTSPTTQAAAGSGGSDTTARLLAGAGIVLGAAGVAYGVLAGRRRGGGART